MKQATLFLFAIALSIASAYSDSQSSANYSITVEALDRGGQRTTSANYTNDGSAGLISGKSNTASGRVVAESGYVAQLDSDDNAPLAIISAVSRKAHVGVGTFDIFLPVTGTPGIECRTGGAGGNYQVIVYFATPVSVNGVSVTSIDGQASGTQSVNDTVVTVNLSAVANAQTILITLTGVNNGSTTGHVVVPLSILIGDTNGSGTVNAGDTLQTRSRSGQATDGTNFHFDVNADGIINSGDALSVRSRSGSSIP